MQSHSMKEFPIWNPDFEAKLRAIDWSFQEGKESMVYWDAANAGNIVLAFVVLITLIDLAVVVYKTWRYGTEGR